MSSAKVKHDGAKRRKNKRGSGVVQGCPCSSLGEMAAGTSSIPSIPSLPSTSLMASPLETASICSSSKAGLSVLETTGSSSGSKEMEQKKMQSKYCEENTTPIQICSQSRMAASATETVSETEPIESDGNVEEVVDLTCEPSIVDLTHNDSVVFVDEVKQCPHPELRAQVLSHGYILCSDDDSECRESDVPVASKLSSKLDKETVGSSGSSGTVSCPICMDGYAEIVRSGRLIVSTKCGHIFCSQCLCNSLRNASFCPTCRKKLNHKQYHPIYI
nr:39S ribosomal protein L21, mitochondrial isoform X1 [Pogona vitticeps]XP_020639750.1 39S ribosomal protein L21, mitochondrial isoform X1 [Pogona vitticeps]